ncbi:multiple antibiotic resistance (MarC)-related protein [Thioalkalivibrio sp. K90mix]|uniref:MarC family protein n=1 Tax=Thioalkalivibrio sp. (strain K90mix) TaxID=396595 RepID=UPI000195A5A5|nr:MarC family protein [Thioalkalivibrio sp. K90mix]ADC71102.1 multiple antibiotic resistance (MarC)-related protein [Thioalkalivibrio sp. K90mix]
MLVLLEYLVVTFLAVFVIVNPLTTAFIFMAMLPRASEEKRRAIALRSVKVATSLLFAFALLGGVIFQLFGITLAAFRIAGGIILFGIAIGMIRQKGATEKETAEEVKADKGQVTEDISVIPLAIPFMSGPGAIATVMILTSEAPTVYHTGLVFLGVLACMVACYFAMIYSRYIVQYLGDTGKDILTKVFGLILAVLAVQFVINGISDAAIGFMLDTQMLDENEVEDPRVPARDHD